MDSKSLWPAIRQSRKWLFTSDRRIPQALVTKREQRSHAQNKAGPGKQGLVSRFLSIEDVRLWPASPRAARRRERERERERDLWTLAGLSPSHGSQGGDVIISFMAYTEASPAFSDV